MVLSTPRSSSIITNLYASFILLYKMIPSLVQKVLGNSLVAVQSGRWVPSALAL